jgi:hypothetical protein
MAIFEQIFVIESVTRLNIDLNALNEAVRFSVFTLFLVPFFRPFGLMKPSFLA